MTFTVEQNRMLKEPLDPKHVVKPSGSFGPKGDYLEGWHVINELNRVFGFDAWSYTVNLSRDALVEGQDSKGNVQWQAAYTCVCTLDVRGVVRQDVGFGSGFAKTVGDAIEGATKESVTDSLKRAARTFGNVFGLALYDKSRANVQAPTPEMITDRTRDMIGAKVAAAKYTVQKVCEAMEVMALTELTEEDGQTVLQLLDDRIAKIAQKQGQPA